MLNKVTFQGRFTADPELRQTASGVFFCNFDVAWSEKYKEVESTRFLKCRAWRTTAEFLPKYFHKGDQVIIEGQLITNSWTDDQGQKHSTIICDVDKCHFCGAKGGACGSRLAITKPSHTSLRNWVRRQSSEGKSLAPSINGAAASRPSVS